jgi:ParB family chromosome partitioning protein
MSKVPPKRDFKNVTLFSDDSSENLESNVSILKMDKIVLPPSQPRRYFSPEAMESLVASIQREGILQPLLVRPIQDKFELVAGERRYRAAHLLSFSEVPVVIRELDDVQAKLISLTENLQREDLNPVEETEGILALLSLKTGLDTENVYSWLNRLDHEARGNIKIVDDNISAHNVMGKTILEEIFSCFNLTWQSFLKNRLPLLNLPEEVLTALREGKLEYTKAKAIAKIKSEKKRKDFLKQAIEENLSLSQIKERIEASAIDKQNSSSPPLASPQKEIVNISQRLKKAQLWKKDPKKWRKAQTLLKKLNELLEDGGEEVGLNDNQD